MGAFVLGALLLALAAVFAIGGPAFFEKKIDCIAYFEDNISGLDVGAPVEYQGVKIGAVTDVRLECDLSTLQFARPVRFQLATRAIHYSGTARDATPRDVLDALVRSHGLRAQLSSQSLLTGKLKITLAHDPDTPVALADRDDDNDAFEIPTIPTPLSVAAKKLSDLPLAEILADIRSFLAGISALVNAPELADTVAQIPPTLSAAAAALSSASETLDLLRDRLPPLFDTLSSASATASATLDDLQPRLPALLDSLATASESASKAADAVTATLAPDSPQGVLLSDTLSDLQDAARSLRLLLDFLEQHPDALLRGKTVD
ncbi:MAG: MCE family protein [Kiritimatiellae bacterium]|nr:MCE family protein [Kiritimatiellia bacterium]